MRHGLSPPSFLSFICEISFTSCFTNRTLTAVDRDDAAAWLTADERALLAEPTILQVWGRHLTAVWRSRRSNQARKRKVAVVAANAGAEGDPLAAVTEQEVAQQEEEEEEQAPPPPPPAKKPKGRGRKK